MQKSKKIKRISISKLKKKASNKSISDLKKLAWQIFSKWVRERDGYRCITCGKMGAGSFMHAGHFISRKHNATMFSEKNVHAQCMNCNLWGYGNMGVYALFLEEKYGKGIIKELTDLSRTIHQFTVQELEEIIRKYSL